MFGDYFPANDTFVEAIRIRVKVRIRVRVRVRVRVWRHFLR